MPKIVVVLCLLLALPAYAEDPPPKEAPAKAAPKEAKKKLVGFGKLKWGMSPKQVRKHLKYKKYKGLYLVQKMPWAGFKPDVSLDFTAKGELARVNLMVKMSYINPQQAMVDIVNITELLTKKYGEPDVEKAKWTNDMFADDVNKYGLAVASGHLSLIYAWNLDGTTIIAAAQPNGKGSAKVIVFYDDPSRRAELKADQQKAKLKDL